MSTNTNISKSIFNPTNTIIGIALLASTIAGFSYSQLTNINNEVRAAGANSFDLILGQKVVGNKLEVTSCLKGDTTQNLAEATLWLKFPTPPLTPVSAIVEPGIYSGPADESQNYGVMTWSLAAGTTDTWQLADAYVFGPGLPIPTTSPALFGKVAFDISGAGTQAVAVETAGTSFLSKQNGANALTYTVINTSDDCRNYGAVAQTSSSSAPAVVTSSSAPAVMTSSSAPAVVTSSSAVPVTGNIGTAPTAPIVAKTNEDAPTIALNGNTFPDNTPAAFMPEGSTTEIAGTIKGGNFVPNAGQKIPANAKTGSAVGTLRVSGNAQTLQVPTNFAVGTPATTNGTTSGTTSGTVTIIDLTNKASSSTAGTTPAATTTPTTTPTTNSTTPANTETKLSVDAQSNTTATNKTKVNNQSTMTQDEINSVRTGGLNTIQFTMMSMFVFALSMFGYSTYRKSQKSSIFNK